MRPKIVDLITNLIQQDKIKEPIVELCAGWDEQVKNILKSNGLKDYIRHDAYDWGNIDVIEDITKLSFESNKFNTVLLLEALEHIAEPQKAIDEVFRIIKPSGFVVITTHMCWELHGREEYRDYWRFLPDGLKYLLKNFKDVEIVLEGSSNEPWGSIYAFANKGKKKE